MKAIHDKTKRNTPVVFALAKEMSSVEKAIKPIATNEAHILSNGDMYLPRFCRKLNKFIIAYVYKKLKKSITEYLRLC